MIKNKFLLGCSMISIFFLFLAIISVLINSDFLHNDLCVIFSIFGTSFFIFIILGPAAIKIFKELNNRFFGV